MTVELLPLSIGIGLVVSLIVSEVFGVGPGGMVVAGYLALHLTRPGHVLATIGAGLATFAIVHALSTVTILYGRRRTTLTILVGYLVGMCLRFVLQRYAQVHWQDFDVIGFIIPGLIAIGLDRQGVIETIASLLTVSVIVRLILILTVGEALRG